MKVGTIRSAGCLAGLVAAIALTGCTTETWDWDWDWWRQGKTAKQQRPVTQARGTANRSSAVRTAGTDTRKPADKRANQVITDVQQYVQDTTPRIDSTYVPNDFNEKIRRQEDPNRRKRIQKTTDLAKTEPAVATRAPNVRQAAAEQQPRAGDGMPAPSPGTRETPQESDRGSTDPISAPNRAEADPAGSPAANQPSAPPVTSDTAAMIPTKGAGESSEPPGSGTKVPERPPVLDARIKVSAGPEPPAEDSGDGGDNPRPVTNAPAPSTPPVDTFNERMKELESRVKEDPNDLEAQYRWRMLSLVNGQADKALAPIDGTDSEMEEVIQAHFRALIAAQSAPGRDAALNANEQLDKIEELRNIIRARADLKIPRVVLCTSIEGFGWYTPMEPAEFQAGRKNPILVYVEVDNFRSEKTPSGMYRTLLSVRQSLMNRSGEELWSTQDANIEDLARRRRRDFFLTLGPRTIHETLAPGEYTLRIEVEDVLAGKINSNVAKFKLVP